MNDLENGRRLFTIAAVIDGKNIAEGKAFNKKDASQIAAQLAVEKLGIVNSDSLGEENGTCDKEAHINRPYLLSIHNSISTPFVCLGCKKQTNLLSAPGLGVSFSNTNPSFFNRFISASISVTSKAI